jgi:hypothetical protein
MLLRLGLQERQQVGVDLILMRGCKAVRCTRIVDFLCAPDESRRLHRRVLHGNDLVVLAIAGYVGVVAIAWVTTEVRVAWEAAHVEVTNATDVTGDIFS